MGSEVVESVLKEFFEFSEEGYKNYRADGEIADYHKFLEKQKANGRLGGRPKKGKKPTANLDLTQSEPKKSLNNKQQTTNNIRTPEGVSSDLWSDFIAYRKRLKAPVTDRVVNRLIKESKDANMTLEQAIETMIFKGWRSFDATWIKSDVKQVNNLDEMMRNAK